MTTTLAFRRAIRGRELARLTKADLIRRYLSKSWCLETATTLRGWSKDDLVSSLLDAEFGTGSR